ncbi:MAG: YtpI family protein [Bacillaceae bacterium]
MPITFILISLSLAMYLFYKVQYFRAKTPAYKQWLSAKSSIALGLFVALFGINYQFINLTTVSIIIGIIFVLVGVGSVWAGVGAYRHYLPFAIKERQEVQ